MIFLGDYASVQTVNLSKMREAFADEFCVVNLEGAIVKEEKLPVKKAVVFNTFASVRALRQLNVKLVAAANNHFFDLGNRMDDTREILSRNRIAAIGAGKNAGEANVPFCVLEDGQEYVIFSCCWKMTGGKTASAHRPGVASADKKNIGRCIKNAKEKRPNAKIVFIIHWGIELEKYPEPMHRELARYAVDCGADLIIGHHPHCIQPIEKYKDRYIFYSIGNFFIEENRFFSGRLDYPAYARSSLAVGVSGAGITVYCLSIGKNEVECRAILKAEEAMQKYGFPSSAEERYTEWFRRHRTKKKLVPVYDSLDNGFENRCKDFLLKLRGAVIRGLVLLHIKNGRGFSG